MEQFKRWIFPVYCTVAYPLLGLQLLGVYKSPIWPDDLGLRCAMVGVYGLWMLWYAFVALTVLEGVYRLGRYAD